MFHLSSLFINCNRFYNLLTRNICKYKDHISSNKYIYCPTVCFFKHILFESPAVTPVVVSHVGGLIVSVRVIGCTDLGFREVVALQVGENHLDLKHNARTCTGKGRS